MKSLFLYGTLRHLPLLETVVGHRVMPQQLSAADLPDHRIHWAEGQAFPLILSATGAAATGLLVEGLSAEDVARLDYYERVFDYDLRWVELTRGEAQLTVQMFWPPHSSYTAGPEFCLQEWAEIWGDINCRAAEEVMRYYGRLQPAEVTPLYRMIHARAASNVAAARDRVSPALSGLAAGDVEVEAISTPYVNFFAIEERQLRYRRFDGALSETVNWASFLATDASLVLAYDPDRDRVVLLEQFRMGPMSRGDQVPWQLEPIAGRVDPGETPEACAHREALEEAGLQLRQLELIHRGYPSPGCSSEYFHIYLGLADLPDEAGGIGGVAGEHEDIQAHVMDFAAAMDLLDQGAIRVVPLALALHWLARNRERLRASG